MPTVELKHPFIYSIHIKIRQPYIIDRIGGILYNYLTHNECAIFTRTNIFENDVNYTGVEIKVLDHNPSKNKKTNENNAIALAKLILHAFHEERGTLHIRSKVFWIYNDRLG